MHTQFYSDSFLRLYISNIDKATLNTLALKWDVRKISTDMKIHCSNVLILCCDSKNMFPNVIENINLGLNGTYIRVWFGMQTHCLSCMYYASCRKWHWWGNTLSGSLDITLWWYNMSPSVTESINLGLNGNVIAGFVVETTWRHFMLLMGNLDYWEQIDHFQTPTSYQTDIG